MLCLCFLPSGDSPHKYSQHRLTHSSFGKKAGGRQMLGTVPEDDRCLQGLIQLFPRWGHTAPRRTQLLHRTCVLSNSPRVPMQGGISTPVLRTKELSFKQINFPKRLQPLNGTEITALTVMEHEHLRLQQDPRALIPPWLLALYLQAPGCMTQHAPVC